MSDPWINDVDDTTALLQDEIARLEDELRLRDETLAAFHATGEPLENAADVAARENRIVELTTELAARDEMVAILLEQVRLLEEAEATSRAEWEQLNRWVQDVERRVDSRDTEDRDLLLELETERNRAEGLEAAARRDRDTWESHREVLEQEVARLRAELLELARRPGSDADAALQALEHENRRLRETCHSLVRASAETAEVGNLRNQMAGVVAQLDEARRTLREALDERARERNEYQVALAAVRSQMAIESLKQAEAPADRPPPADRSPPVSTPAEPTASLSPDERIRALRQHLLEIHDREEADRMKNSLSTRLSRLWRSTRPVR